MGVEQEDERANKTACVICMPGNTPAAMLDVKEKYAFAEEVYWKRAELISAAKEMRCVLKRAMKSIQLVYDVCVWWDFDSFRAVREDIFCEVKVVVCDPACNTRPGIELLNSEHNWLGLQVWSHVVELLSAVMYVWEHGHLSGSELQYKTLYDLIVGKL